MAMRMSEEEYATLEEKIAKDKAERAAQENQTKPPETQTPPQETPGQEQPGPLKKSFLSRAREVATTVKDDLTGSTHAQRVALREAEAQTKYNKKMATARGEVSEEAPVKDSKPSRDFDSPSSKRKSKKGKHKSLDDLFDDMDDEDDDFGSSRSKRKGKDSPVGVYESAYHHNKPMPYQSAYLPNKPTAYSEAYTARKLADNGVYKSPVNPRTYDMSRGEPQQQPQQQQGPRPAPQPMKMRASMPMPTIGSFNGNIKMPTISLGGTPRIAGAHKMGPGNMPSINIPTLGGSTLMVGSGLMKKTANNKIGVGKFDIPTIGNWGKAPLKTKLETPNIGNLTIMGAGKGGMGFGLGEVPRFGLSAPGKRKK